MKPRALKRVKIKPKRSVIKWSPRWEGEIEGWVINFIQRNVWRVSPEHGPDDLYQDAYIYFMDCKDRYPRVVDPPHFMRLFQTCLRNHLHTLASKRSTRAEIRFSSYDDEGGDTLEQLIAAPDHLLAEVELALRTEDATEPLKRLFAACMARANPAPFRKIWGQRETTNERLCRLAKVDPTTPLRQMVEAFFTGDGRADMVS